MEKDGLGNWVYKWHRVERPPAEVEELGRQKQEVIRSAATTARAEMVAAIKVATASGRVFDGDEISQGRMARAIIAMETVGRATTAWVLADNTAALVSSTELREALVLAGQAQTDLWVI